MKRTLTIDWVTITYESATPEQFVVKEVLIDWCYDFDFKPDDIVLNLWGHIWSFDLFASPRVAKIVTFEPVESDYNKILKHLKMNNFTNVSAHNCPVTRNGWEISFYTSKSWHHSILWWVDEIKMGSMAIENVFFLYPFTKIKCDIEGGEYSVFQWLEIPQLVNEMWFETHTRSPELMEEHKKLIKHFESQGFGVKEIKNDEQDRTFLLHCKR